MRKAPLLPVVKDATSRVSWSILMDASMGVALASVTTPLISAETMDELVRNSSIKARQIEVLDIHLSEAM